MSLPAIVWLTPLFMPWGTNEWRPNYSSMRASWSKWGFLRGFFDLSYYLCNDVLGRASLFLKILPLHSFQTSQIIKPGTRVQDLLMISLHDKSFLQFFKVLVMLSLSLSVFLKTEASQSHNVEVNGKRLSKCSIVSSCKPHRWYLDGKTKPLSEDFPKLEFSFVEPTT